MRFAIDATVLANAVNRYMPEHPRAAQVLEDLANGSVPWALPWPAAHDFLRSVTHPHTVVRPLAAREAVSFLARVLEAPTVHAIGPGPAYAAALAEIAALSDGPLPAGHELAAVLREHGVRELLSADRAMRKFPFLEVVNPLRGARWSPDVGPTRRYRRLRSRTT